MSIPSAGARERKWVIKPGRGRRRGEWAGVVVVVVGAGGKALGRRAGASDSGIHLIAPK